MRTLIAMLAALSVAVSSYGDEAQMVTAHMEDERIVVQVNGDKFTAYLFGQEHKYPFFYPVIGPTSGESVTTWDQEPFPHHSSLYISLDNVRSENVDRGNYWQPRHQLETGQIFSRNARIGKQEQGRVVLHDETDWIVTATNSHQLQDRRTVTIWAPSPTIRIMDFEFEITAMKDLEVRQTGHSFFSARMRPEIAVGSTVHGPEWADMGTGAIVDSNGNRDEAETRERDADWCAYYGEIKGVTEGLAIIQHSQNPMYPAKWFNRDYGFMSPTPFAFDGNVEMKAGETMTFRYRVVVFTGDHEAADIAGWREEFEAR